MLQQTQVNTVIPYFLRWMDRWPTIQSLSNASQEEALGIWQGLGYYSRCKRLLDGAKWVVSNGLPQSASDWQKVPGVGAYTAGAIASIAFGEPVPVADGNVERVFARLTDNHSAGSELKKAAWLWARDNLVADVPGDWNQALMELGATVCTPRTPRCPQCPVSDCCRAFGKGNPETLPVAIAKGTARLLTHVTCIPRVGLSVGVEPIPEGEWWAGMWQFPRTDGVISDLTDRYKLCGTPRFLGRFKHSVTNHRITLEVWELDMVGELSGLRWVTPEQLALLPMPAPQRRASRMMLEST